MARRLPPYRSVRLVRRRMLRLNAVGSRTRQAVTCGTLSLLAACGDSTAPGAGSAFFRLATVNSRPLPFICPPGIGTSVSCVIYRGELLLRRDATFTLGIEGIPFLFEGTYVRARDSVRYTVPNGDPSQPPIVFSVDFDTLRLKDGVFFEQHRAESSTVYPPRMPIRCAMRVRRSPSAPSR